MRCAIKCVKYLYKIYGYDDTSIVNELEKKMSEQGINMYDLLLCLQNNGIQAKAYYGWFLPKEKNVILYLDKKVNHYLILKRKGIYYAWIYDGELGERKIGKWRLYFLYSHKYILCYNK